MESASAPAQASSAPAQRGTLADPEILQNVPGHLIPIIEREFDDFKTESTKFLQGEMPEDEFIKFRLKQGVYGQRQADVQMIRVKLPFGGITPEQMESFADVIEKYVPLNKGHITTRQNVQMHHIPLPEVELAIRELGESGLSSREGCGNTVQERDRRSVGGRREGRAVRHDAVRGRVRALLRTPPHYAGDAAEDQDGVRRLPARPGDLRHPRHRLPRAHEARSTAAAPCAARRCSSAAAPRSCRAWRPCCTSSSSSTTATT